MHTRKFEIKNGFVQVPVEVFKAIEEQLEDFADAHAFKEAIAKAEEAYPLELVEHLLDGENPVRVFRDYRGLSQVELADKAGLSQAMVSAIEGGHKTGTVHTLKALAAALEVDLDELV